MGRGGGQNIADLLFLRGIDTAITQQEQLSYVKSQDKAAYANIETRIQYITKLYESEFHLLAHRNLKSLKDLDGKRVSLSKAVSATDIGGRTIFEIAGVHPILVNDDLGSAIQKLKKGDLDAVAYFAGAPIPAFTQITDGSNLHFIPLNGETIEADRFLKLLQLFLPSRLEANAYPSLIPNGESVPTVASSAVLASYAWPEGSPQYQKLAKFIDKFFSNFDTLLQPPHHPKWREVNLGARIPGWIRAKPAQEWLDRHQDQLASQEKMRIAFSKFLDLHRENRSGEPISQEKQDELWKQFQLWYVSTQKTAG